MFIKNISHLYKRKRFNNGYALVVGGYPRSGTTLLSEIIGRLTHYHFDRNNIFPNSGLFTWHTHWSPERLCGDKSIFIIRDPLEVAESLYYYSRYYGLQVQVPDLLTSSKLCRLGWISYYKSIIRNNGRLITYQDLISNDSKAIKNISEFNIFKIVDDVINEMNNVINQEAKIYLQKYLPVYAKYTGFNFSI